MRMSERMRAKLEAAFQPQHLEIIDESEQHRGHGGYREGGESHFRVILRAESLAGKSRVAQQRAVYACLKDEMDEQIHALALEVSG